MDTQVAYNILTSHSTLDFLKEHGLIISGQSHNGVTDCRISNADGKRYRIDGSGGTANDYVFRAYNVPMQSEEKDGITMVVLPALNGLTLPAAGGPSIMVTGQLSGCSFVYQPRNDGSLKVAHIQPGSRVDGDVANAKTATSGMSLAMDLSHSGNFVGSTDEVKVFGSNYYQHQHSDGTSRCTILGIRRLNGWNLYAQIYTQQGRSIKSAIHLYGN